LGLDSRIIREPDGQISSQRNAGLQEIRNPGCRGVYHPARIRATGWLIRAC
jgi:hypothetical protein